MPMLGMLTLLGAAATVPAVAATPIELWNGFTTASTPDQIKAFVANQPKRRIEVFPGCFSGFGRRFENGQLVSIIFNGKDNGGDCFERMSADLRTRLGQPELQSLPLSGGYAFGTATSVTSVSMSSTALVYIWRDAEKKTKVIRRPDDRFILIFTVRPDNYVN